MSTSPAPFEPGNGLPSDPLARLGDIKNLRDITFKYMEENWWKEFEEVWRAVSCRTKPIMVKVDGKDVEDKNRTNVCMPELAVAVKRKTARLTANPPNMRYLVPGDDNSLLGERLTARAYYEYDRSGEVVEFRRGVQQAETFGFSYFKTYYDQVDIVRQMRYQRAKMRDRQRVMQMQGAEQDQIDEAVKTLGPELNDQEVEQAIQENGPELRGNQPFTLYEGPVSKCRFIGDIGIEPGCLTLNLSGWVFEKYTETDLWLKKKSKQTYVDPESGEDVPIFDAKQVQELYDQDLRLTDEKKRDLKRDLRTAVSQTIPRLETRLLPFKRFDIDEYHAPDKYGRMWIEYIGNDSVYLGRQPVPFDLGGKFVYTELIPWPNLIGAIGDSSPRLLRFLHKMHNAAVGQRNDLIAQILRRNYVANSEEDIPDAMYQRDFGNVIVRKGGPGSFDVFTEPDVPQSAWESEAQIKSEMMQAEPAIGNIESAGTEFNPQSGKTATTSILASKSNDVLIQLELDSLNICVKEMGEKKLEIHRQMSDGLIPVPGRFMAKDKMEAAQQYQTQQMSDPAFKEQFEALSQRFDKTSLITIDPYEIQDPSIEVEPEAGSTLAVDDELKKNSVMQFYQLAATDPVLFNQRYAAEQLCATIRGIDKSKALNPPAPPPPPPPPKVGINLSLDLSKVAQVPNDILEQILPMVGLQPSQDIVKQQEMEGVQHLSRAADAVSNLLSPAKPPEDALTKQTGKVERQVNASGT